MVVAAKELKELVGLKEIREHLRLGERKMDELLAKVQGDKSLPAWPAHKVEGKGPWRVSVEALDQWWKTLIEALNSGRSPYMKRVNPRP